MNYDKLSPEEKKVVDGVVGDLQSFVSKLDKAAFPEHFYIFDIVKSDEIIGRCVFANSEDLEKFRQAYALLTPSGEWGSITAEIANPKSPPQG